MGYNINDVYPSGGDWLKTDDLKREDGSYGSISVVIDQVDLIEIKDYNSENMVKKLQLSFVGKEKLLVLNATNCRNIGMSFGEKTDPWPGKTIGISVHSTSKGPGLLVTAQPGEPRESFDALDKHVQGLEQGPVDTDDSIPF